jgi:hypothetical protein
MGTDTESSSTATGLLALLGPLAIWGTAFGVRTATASSDIASGQCSGIGFGCTMSPHDLAQFVGMYLGIPVVSVATLVTVLGLCAPERMRRTVVVCLLTVFTLGTGVLVAAIPAST